MPYLIDTILTQLKSSTVAAAAGVNAVTWSNDRVFYRKDWNGFLGKINVGRLPMVCVYSLPMNYDQTAENGGEREATFIIRVLDRAFLLDESDRLQGIKVAIMTALRGETSLEIFDTQSSDPATIPGAHYIDITAVSTTVYDRNNYNEG